MVEFCAIETCVVFPSIRTFTKISSVMSAQRVDIGKTGKLPDQSPHFTYRF